MEIHNHTPYRLGWIAGKLQPPAHSLSLVVKGTFRLAHAEPARPLDAEEQAPLDGDRAHDEDPNAGPRYDSDFALFKPRADLLLVGTCHVPGGRPRPACRVAFGVGRKHKELVVAGDRRWVERPLVGLVPGEPEPFRAMPLRYERSFGGPGFARNPLGKGYVPPSAPGQAPRPGPVSLPNIEHPDRLLRAPADTPDPAGFGPLDRRWADRGSKLGTFDQKWLAERWPNLPADLDPGYFNAAPADQQVPYLRGDEPLVFENLHPEIARFESRLPGLRMRCFLQADPRSGAAFREVPLRLDTLWADMDGGALVLVWRGVTAVASRDHEELEKVLLVSESLSEPALPPDHYREDGWWQRPGKQSEYDAAANDEAEARAHAEEEARERAEAAEPPDEDAKAADAAMEKALADARVTLQKAGVSGALFDRMLASDSPDAAIAMLTGALKLDPKAAEDVQKEARARTKQLLADHGVDPKLLDDLDREEDDEEGAPAKGARLSREALEQRVRAGESCAGVDASELDLAGANLSGADLSGADLTRAKLAGARLDGADLREARLDGADLGGASLKDAVLVGATLAGAGLASADLSGAQLAGVKLAGAVLFAARLDRADLAGASLTGCDLRSASLAAADLEKADLSLAVLRDASGSRARLAGAALIEADLTGAMFERADFTGATMDRALFERATLRGAFFYGALGVSVKMAEADLRGARAGEGCVLAAGDFRRIRGEGSFWSKGNLQGADFSGSTLEGASFEGSALEQCNFHRAVLKRANLAKTRLASARLTKVDLFRGRLDQADLTGADCQGSSFFECDFEDTVTTKTRFGGSNLGRTIFAARARALA